MKKEYVPFLGVIVLILAICGFFAFISVLSYHIGRVQVLILIALLLISIQLAAAIGIILGYKWSRWFYLGVGVLNFILWLLFVFSEGYAFSSLMNIFQIVNLLLYVPLIFLLCKPASGEYFQSEE